MFLDRSNGRGTSDELNPSDRKRTRLIALGLAVGAATPLVGTSDLMAQAAEPTTQPTVSEPAQPTAAATSTDGRELYYQGREYYYSGDWINARKALEASKAAGYSPGGFTRSQDWFLNKMTAKEQADAEKVQKDAAAAALAAQQQADKAAQTKADGEAAAAKAAAAQSDEEKKVQAAQAYKAGVSDYKKGDWIGARVSFMTAHELGYKASWYETSPASYLEKMDKKEQADSAKHAAEVAA